MFGVTQALILALPNAYISTMPLLALLIINDALIRIALYLSIIDARFIIYSFSRKNYNNDEQCIFAINDALYWHCLYY